MWNLPNRDKPIEEASLNRTPHPFPIAYVLYMPFYKIYDGLLNEDNSPLNSNKV